MESLIKKIELSYENELKKEISSNSPKILKNKSDFTLGKASIKEGLDKIIVFLPKHLEMDKDSLIIPPSLNNKSFPSNMYEDLNEDKMLEFLETNKVPMSHFNKLIKDFFKVIPSSYKNKKGKIYINKNIVLKFLGQYKEKLCEKNIFYIIQKINDIYFNNDENEDKFNQKSTFIDINEIICYILVNISVDENYFLSIYKEENVDINKNLIIDLNEIVNRDKENKIKKCWLNIIKSLNLIFFLRQKIKKKEYDEYEKKINKNLKEILDIEENKEIDDEELIKEINLEFIKSLKKINSNPSKSKYIEEKIII